MELVEAQVIDDDLMISQSSFEIDMSGIQRDVEELTEAIDEALTVYGEMLVEPQVIVEMSYEDVRRCERAVSSVIRAADELRRKLNRDYKVPLDRAKERYDELMGPVAELHAAYKDRRVALDEAAKLEKLEAIRAMYEKMAAYMALPLEGQQEALVPFSRIHAMYGAKWTNKSAHLVDIERELLDIVQRIAAGEIRLDAEALAHPAEAKAVYWQTLDVDAALARDRELTAAAERMVALEAQRAANQLPKPEKLPEPEKASEPEKPPEPAQLRKPRVMLIDGATDDECRQIGQLCKQLGITGVFKGERFYEQVKAL